MLVSGWGNESTPGPVLCSTFEASVGAHGENMLGEGKWPVCRMDLFMI